RITLRSISGFGVRRSISTNHVPSKKASPTRSPTVGPRAPPSPQVVQLCGLYGIPFRFWVFPAVAQRPAHLGAIGLGPPAVQLGAIKPAIDQHLHTAGAAGFPRPSWSVEPQIHSLHQVLGECHVVVLQEDYAVADGRLAGEAHELLHQTLALLVL